METIRLGRTGLAVGRTAFGAIPIQRIGFDEAAALLRRAMAGGVNFFDTARGYSDSEAKIGQALSGARDRVILATKTAAADKAGVLRDLRRSLEELQTDHVDILQLHNPAELPDPADGESAYAGLLEARRRGKVRFVGITSHRLANALAAAASGLYDTVQYPLSAISSEADLALIDVCRRNDVGLIAMKPLCGGLLTSARSAFAFLRQFDNVVPIWGVQRMGELEELLALEEAPPALDASTRAAIRKDRAELAGQFCRACGYCLPCPADIPIPTAARMTYLMRRAPAAQFTTEEWRAKMRRIEDCTQCRQCADRCPYQLDTPALLRRMYEDYQAYLARTGA